MPVTVRDQLGGRIPPGWIPAPCVELDNEPWDGFDVPWLDKDPSEYFRRQCWISFDADESTIPFTATSPYVGADRIVWASDFPHPDAKYPGTTALLAESVAELDPADQQTKAVRSEIDGGEQTAFGHADFRGSGLSAMRGTGHGHGNGHGVEHGHGTARSRSRRQDGK